MTLNRITVTKVGMSAPRSKPSGLTASSLKYFFNILIPAGLGALAITVNPPPVTAPATNEILKGSLKPSTREPR